MGVSQSKKYTKSTASNEIQLDFKKEIQPQLKIMTNWSFEQIREVCLAFKRYSYQSPYVTRFTFKKLLALSDRISNEIFYSWAQGDKYVSFYEFVCGLVLTSYNTFKRKLQFLYLVFNFQHTQSIKLKNYILMYECMIFAYCRLTKQEFPSFQAVRKYLYEEYLTSESMEVLQGAFQFRRLIEEVQVNQVTRQLFMRFQGDIMTAKEKPTTLMLNGLAKYDKLQSQKIFKIIKKVYQDKNFEDIESNQLRKKQRLQTRRLSVLNNVQEDKQKYLQKTRDFRIKNRSYSLKQFDGYGTKIVYKGPVNHFEDKGINTFYSSSSKIFNISKHDKILQTAKSVNFKSPSINKISSFSMSIQQKAKQLTERKLSKIKLQSLTNNNKPKNVIFLGGKAYTKSDFFQTIQYFNSLSNNKDEIKIKEFFKTFENKTFLKRQLYSLFKFFDKNLNGEISFEQFIKRTYPNIDRKFFQRLKQWNIDYKNIYQADKILIKKEKKQTKIELPEDAKQRIQQIFVSFGGEKGYLTFEDIRVAYTTGFSMQECENVVKEFGEDGKIYVDGFARMLLPDGYVIQNCDWHIKKKQKPVNLTNNKNNET